MTMLKLSEFIVSEAKIRRLAEENPDLTYEFIKILLIAQQEAKVGELEEYSLDGN
jgi:hypothetical protein